ncbi:1939_t:CDS:2 [Cetraspora pellucida]|uniref:1939_t:CDS:1 n=1 Tax=Cetraspora pellucida TaxID=1433469 RepID=A0A9N9FN59_9GLOM|nr:1939_t:CDS:2 [Cetraspora pellucida]
MASPIPSGEEGRDGGKNSFLSYKLIGFYDKISLEIYIFC